MKIIFAMASVFATRLASISQYLRMSARLLAVILLAVSLGGCIGNSTYRAYSGPERSELEIAKLQGEAYLRQDWLNRYVDSVRFESVDGININENRSYASVEVAPGFHDVTVFFYWDMGNARGLAQALVQYAASHETLSRTLRFNARAGEQYTIKAEPVFHEGPREVTNLSHVNFWVEDSNGQEVVTQEQGRYIPSS